MATLRIYGGAIYTPFEVIEDGALLIQDGVIQRVGPRAKLASETPDEEVDAGGRLICPGFVDLQVNGGGDALLTAEPEPAAVERIAKAHLSFGTTALLPTIVTADEATMARALAAVAACSKNGSDGVLGAHLEGPFLNPVRRGAHEARFLQPPRLDLFERLLAAAQGTLRLITLAPELPGVLELIGAARRAGVAVAIGHSDASYEEAAAAIRAGATLGTHAGNAMRPLHQREPGVLGALLESPDVTVSLIADGVHVHPAVLALIARAKGAARTALITDAMPPVGGTATAFALHGAEIAVRDGACYTKDGVLAGSALSMARAVRTMHRAGLPLRDCIEMATATPAHVLGLDQQIGVLQRGARADVVICDGGINVWRVYAGGVLVYAADG